MHNLYNEKIYNIKQTIKKLTTNDVKIIVVTKYQDYDIIKKIDPYIIDGYAESKVQDLIYKQSNKCFKDHKIHFIGHLQSNKIKKLMNYNVELIQSIDSLNTIDLISKYCLTMNKIQNILIQVKLDNDINRFGVNINKLENFLLECSKKKCIKIKGLMYMPSNMIDKKNKYIIYSRLYKEFIDISKKKYNNTSMDILSMGTSHDFNIAISCGANMIRIGNKIFN